MGDNMFSEAQKNYHVLKSILPVELVRLKHMYEESLPRTGCRIERTESTMQSTLCTV